MAFVSGHKHDLFLSYAHAEAAWTEAFRKALCAEFHVRTGAELTVWQDSRNLRLGQNWASEIEEGIRTAAAFLAIVSPIYFNSQWCRQERTIVLEKTLEALKVESFYRFLKVIKTPGPGKAHEELLGDLQDIRFFNPADGYELPDASGEFTARIRDAVRQVRELLTHMSNQGQELYIAPGAIDMLNERDELIRELKDRGFTIKPEVLLDSGFGKGPIRQAMEKVSHAIFILGSGYDAFTADQIEVARELGKPVVYWIQPGARQESLAELPDGSECLGGRSIRELIPPLLGKLKPPKTVEPAASGSGTVQVYLNYDTTLPEDARMADRIAGEVSDRKLQVVRSARDEDHDRRMRSADAVLVIRAAHPAPDEWLKFNARELARAEQYFEKNPVYRAKALLVAEPARIPAQAAGVPVYAWSEPFAPATLDPFFEKLKIAGSSDARR